MKVIIDGFSNQNMIDYTWSGARDTLIDLTWEQITTVRSYLEELYPEGITMTDLNDFLWFERDTIAEWLGYNSYDELLEDKEN